MPAWLARFNSQTLHSTLVLIAVWIALLEAKFPVAESTLLIFGAILAVGFKEGLGKLAKSASS